MSGNISLNAAPSLSPALVLPLALHGKWVYPPRAQLHSSKKRRKTPVCDYVAVVNDNPRLTLRKHVCLISAVGPFQTTEPLSHIYHSHRGRRNHLFFTVAMLGKHPCEKKCRITAGTTVHQSQSAARGFSRGRAVCGLFWLWKNM